MTQTSSLPRFPATNWRLLAVLTAAGLIGLSASAVLPASLAGAAALTAACIGLWATAAIPEYLTALGFFLVAIVTQIAPPATVFSGFHSSTVWLLFSGLVIGAAIRHTGLDRRAAGLLSGMLGASYAGVIAAIIAFSLGLAFVMPNAMGRIVLMVPIVMALADHMGYAPGANGRTGMLTAAAFGTWAPAFSILPSNAPNMMLAGMAETLYGQQPSYFEYLALHFPVLGALKGVALVGLILWMFPDRDPERSAASLDHAEPMAPSEQRLAIALALCLGLWLTDGVHGVSPAWVGLAAALYCLWPGSGLTAKTCLNQEINYDALFFVAGVMGLGAVISESGLGEAVVSGLTAEAGFSPDHPLRNVALLTAISTLIGTATNLPGVPAVMTPVAGDLAALTGLPLATVLMTQVLAFSNVVLPHQAPPLMTAAQVARLSTRIVTRMCLALFAVSTLVLVPLDLLWWRLLGMI